MSKAEPELLREHVARLEITANAARSIAQRLASRIDEAAEATSAHAPRLAQLEQALASLREEHARSIAELRSRAIEASAAPALEPIPPAPSPESSGAQEELRASVRTLRVDLEGHLRAFDARRLRIEALEAELSRLRGDQHLTELRRELERLDLRVAGLEQVVGSLRGELARALEARETPRNPEPELASPPSQGVEAFARIKGIGPKTAKALVELGVGSLADVAAWQSAELARVAAALGKRPEQIAKARWVEQARTLLAADARSPR